MFKINKKILLSIFFFLTLFLIIPVNAAFIQDNTDTTTINVSGFIGSPDYGVPLSFTNDIFYDINDCIDNSGVYNRCKQIYVEADMWDFIIEKFYIPSLWKIEFYSPYLKIDVTDNKGNWLAGSETSEFFSISNVSRFESCGQLLSFSWGECTFINGSIGLSLILPDSALVDLNIKVTLRANRVFNRTSQLIVVKKDVGESVESYIASTTVTLQPSDNLNITINTTTALKDEWYSISIDYGEFNTSKSSCYEIAYSTIKTPCLPLFFDTTNFKSITNDTFTIFVWGDARKHNGTRRRARKLKIFSMNPVIPLDNLGTINDTIKNKIINEVISRLKKPLICIGNFPDTTSMLSLFESDSPLCEYTNLKTFNQKNVYSDSTSTGGGGDSSTPVISYKTWGDFASDINILPDETNTIRVFYEKFSRIALPGNYFYGVGYTSKDQGVKRLCKDEVCITLNITKAGTICNSPQNPGASASAYSLEFISDLGKIVNSSTLLYDFSDFISAICKPSTNPSSGGISWGTGLVNELGILESQRYVIYGRSINLGAFSNKTTSSRLTDFLISSNETFYDTYNNTIFNETSKHGYISSSSIIGLKTFTELAPYSPTLSAKFFDFGLSQAAAATLFIDDGSTEILKDYLMKVNFIDVETSKPLLNSSLPVYLSLEGEFNKFTIRVNNIFWQDTLPSTNYTLTAYSTDEKFIDSTTINLNKSVEQDLYFYPNKFNANPSNFTLIDIYIYDGLKLTNQEYFLNMSCGTAFFTGFTTDRYFPDNIVFNNKVGVGTTFVCNINVFDIGKNFITTVNRAVRKNTQKVITIDIRNKITDTGAILTPPDFQLNRSVGGFTDIQVTAYRNLINSAWFLIVELSGGNKLIISIFIMSFAVWIMNFGKPGKTVNSDVQIAVIALIFITLILLGFINAIIGILFIVLLGVLFGKKFHESIGNNGGSE